MQRLTCCDAANSWQELDYLMSSLFFFKRARFEKEKTNGKAGQPPIMGLYGPGGFD
jgi:hypothetical protein